MSELRTVIQLHSIRITSLTNPHDDLPGDTKMAAQLIIEENIFLQTLPVPSEQDQKSWKLGVGWTIPPHAPTFSVAVLRHSETEGKRLVGHFEMKQGEFLRSGESNGSFQCKLDKVNPDGPPLDFDASFSVSELPYKEVLTGIADNTIASVRSQGIASELQKMYEESRRTQFSVDAQQLLVMHERILLCCQSNDNRAQWLNILGDIFLQFYHASGTVDSLNQAVCAYNDAVRDDSGHVIYLVNLGKSLLHRFERLAGLRDINQAIMMLEAAVDRHPDKPSLLNN
ncbi:hypothetical protein K438DRAFT_1947290, partial [Mycena galopus ATCC 62051]